MAKREQSTIHIGKIIRTQLESCGMTKSEFARRINTSAQNIYGIFKRSSIDTALLTKICKVLNHDFFTYYQSGTAVPGAQAQEEVNKLRGEVQSMQGELVALRELCTLQRGVINDLRVTAAINDPIPTKKRYTTT
jgi:predicted transcriptional regulator